jgi:aspartyl-tRNA(Asn)/glutamyl-tRNA(Gln) amidotransferase subunit A
MEKYLREFLSHMLRFLLEGTAEHVHQLLEETMEKLEKKGHTVELVSMPVTMKGGVSAYYTLATSEASTNLSRFGGLRYGQMGLPKNKTFSEYFKGIRSRNFNTESKRRIILGTFTRMAGYRDAYYIKATKVRTKIIEEYKDIFKRYDIILTPTMPVVAPKFSDISKMKPIENYMMDVMTAGPNLSGIPHASIPITDNSLPIGMMASTNHLEEGKLLAFLEVVEGLI